MSAPEIAPGVPVETVVSPHPIDAYYDAVFDTATAQNNYFPYDETRGLIARISADEVRVADPTDSSYKFSICRVPLGGQQVVAFNTCNTIDGLRHPLLYPARLLERAVPLLESAGPVDAVMGYWLAPPAISDNYRDYFEALHRLVPDGEPTAADAATAARGTWTGQRLALLGYSAVQCVEINNYGNVKAFFTRPS